MRLKINRYLLALFIFTFGWLSVTATYSQSGATQGDPVQLLQYIANNMIAGLKSNRANLKNNPGVVYRLAYRYVVPYADLPQMARAVLPPQIWNNATPAQRIEFQKEFTTTLIRTYASALSSYQDQSVRFYPVRGGVGGARTVVVNSDIISSETQPIRVSYRLIRAGSVWRLYDLSVEGVDMLESFRSQFSDILSQGNMDLLLQKMRSHNRGRGRS